MLKPVASEGVPSQVETDTRRFISLDELPCGKPEEEEDFKAAYHESRLVDFINRLVADRLFELGDAFRSLSATEWAVLRLVKRGKSLGDIGIILKRSKGTVYENYKRAVRKLRERCGL